MVRHGDPVAGPRSWRLDTFDTSLVVTSPTTANCSYARTPHTHSAVVRQAWDGGIDFTPSRNPIIFIAYAADEATPTFRPVLCIVAEISVGLPHSDWLDQLSTRTHSLDVDGHAMTRFKAPFWTIHLHMRARGPDLPIVNALA